MSIYIYLYMFIVLHAIVVIVCVIVIIVVFFSLSQQFWEHVSVFFHILGTCLTLYSYLCCLLVSPVVGVSSRQCKRCGGTADHPS